MRITKFYGLAIIAITCTALSSFFSSSPLDARRVKFPYRGAGLTERQAAAHLLSRFTFGATPGQVDSVVKIGLENWFAQQLNGNLPDDSLNKRLSKYDDLNYTNQQVVDVFPNRFYVYDRAVKDSVIARDSIYFAKDKKTFNTKIAGYMKLKGFKPEQDLYNQFYDQKILRAAYTNNQLREVMTDFWFNHFNVSFSKNGPGRFIPSFERDVIRPNVFGRFDSLLIATAKSPAMLYYLDNATSVAPPVTVAPQVNSAVRPTDHGMIAGLMTDTGKIKVVKIVRRPVSGLNENYAREVMELHTLGVDGGYTQKDVTQAAKVLTGWTVYPIGNNNVNPGLKKQFDKFTPEQLSKLGYVHDGDFAFVPNRHDMGEKDVLTHHFNANGGYQEGLDMLSMLAHSPSAAKFITRKIAVRFVSDNPPVSLLNKMSQSFIEHDGDIKQVLITMVSSPEFWDARALREKTKSPFELVISTLRSLNADVQQPAQLYNWAAKMGQKVYYYLAPTGFPDKGQYWINTGSLLSRMNFGLALATQKIPGVRFNLAALNHNHEPESAASALLIYSKLLMPERNLDKTIAQLSPLLNEPALSEKINAVANKTYTTTPDKPVSNANDLMMDDNMSQGKVTKVETRPVLAMQNNKGKNNNDMLGQVVGIIIGSPEFQRR